MKSKKLKVTPLRGQARQKFRAKVKTFKFLLVLLTFSFLLLPSFCFAASNITFDATVDKNIVSLGERIQLSLAFQGAPDVPAPQIKELEGFSAQYLGPSTMMSIINGKVSSSISHVYILAPLNTGKFTIGPFSAEYGNQKYVSRTIDIEVIDQPAPSAPMGISTKPSTEPVAANAEKQLKDRIFVELDVVKKDAYLNEIIPVAARLYINKLAIKGIEYPYISAEGFSKEQFAKPDQYQKSSAGLSYDVIEFKTNVYPLKPGVLNLGPAEIKCNLITRRQGRPGNQASPFGDAFPDDDFFSGFFDRYGTYPLDLKSPTAEINVKPLPDEGKPADFIGAVGDFDMQAEIDQTSVKAGDPVTLKTKITGTGNLATVNAPVLEDAKDIKVYQPQIKMLGGEKIFEQVIIPLSESVAQIPEIRFSFFNPKTQQYQSIKKGPIAITVSKTDEKGQALKPLIERILAPVKEEVLGKDIVYIKDNPGKIVKRGRFLYQRRFFIWIFIWPLIAFIILFLVEMKNKRLRTDIRYARLRGARKKAQKGILKAQNYLSQKKKDEFYAVIFKTLQDYIGDKLHIHSGGITAESAVQHLAEKEVSGETLDKIRKFFNACDAARFAQSAITADDMLKTLNLAREITEALEKVKI